MPHFDDGNAEGRFSGRLKPGRSTGRSPTLTSGVPSPIGNGSLLGGTMNRSTTLCGSEFLRVDGVRSAVISAATSLDGAPVCREGLTEAVARGTLPKRTPVTSVFLDAGYKRQSCADRKRKCFGRGIQIRSVMCRARRVLFANCCASAISSW